MKKKTISKNVEGMIANAFNLLSQANDGMINAIIAAVNESEEGEISYDVTIDESCGYTETRYIGGNYDLDWCVFDENGNEIQNLEDMTADELYDICIKIL